MNQFECFEFHTNNTEQTMKFYNEVFQWLAEQWPEEEGYYPMRTLNTIEVPCINEFIKKVTDHGGQVVVPKFKVEKIGLMAYCKDPEGNIFGIYKPLEK
ncbi:VOC family protein [Bacillus cereus]